MNAIPNNNKIINVRVNNKANLKSCEKKEKPAKKRGK